MRERGNYRFLPRCENRNFFHLFRDFKYKQILFVEMDWTALFLYPKFVNQFHFLVTILTAYDFLLYSLIKQMVSLDLIIL
jgi:hypothetical protein